MKKDSGTVVGLWTLKPKVLGSNPGVCSFSALKKIGLRGTLRHREILA